MPRAPLSVTKGGVSPDPRQPRTHSHKTSEALGDAMTTRSTLDGGTREPNSPLARPNDPRLPRADAPAPGPRAPTPTPEPPRPESPRDPRPSGPAPRVDDRPIRPAHPTEPRPPEAPSRSHDLRPDVRPGGEQRERRPSDDTRDERRPEPRDLPEPRDSSELYELRERRDLGDPRDPRYGGSPSRPVDPRHRGDQSGQPGPLSGLPVPTRPSHLPSCGN